jgi:hypothetical protein
VLNEETLYATYNSPEQTNIDSVRLQVDNYYAPATTDRIIQHCTLPTSDNVSEWKTIFGRIITDGQVLAPSRALAAHLYQHGKAAVVHHGQGRACVVWRCARDGQALVEVSHSPSVTHEIPS